MAKLADKEKLPTQHQVASTTSRNLNGLSSSASISLRESKVKGNTILALKSQKNKRVKELHSYIYLKS